MGLFVRFLRMEDINETKKNRPTSTPWSGCSCKYLKIQFLPQRKHNLSQLQKSIS
jgi:hypothetical protein